MKGAIGEHGRVVRSLKYSAIISHIKNYINFNREILDLKEIQVLVDKMVLRANRAAMDQQEFQVNNKLLIENVV